MKFANSPLLTANSFKAGPINYNSLKEQIIHGHYVNEITAVLISRQTIRRNERTVYRGFSGNMFEQDILAMYKLGVT